MIMQLLTSQCAPATGLLRAGRISRRRPVDQYQAQVKLAHFLGNPSPHEHYAPAGIIKARLDGWLTCTDVADEVSNVSLLEKLGEQVGPVGLYCDASCLYERLDVVSLHQAR